MARQGSTCIEWVQELRVLGSIFGATGWAEGLLVAGYKGLHAETGSVGWSKTSSSCPPRLFKAPLSAPPRAHSCMSSRSYFGSPVPSLLSAAWYDGRGRLPTPACTLPGGQ